MIEDCTSDKEFSILLPNMVEVAGHIRRDNLIRLKRQFGILEFNKKKYLSKLLHELNSNI
jgi:hypothetical protein